VRLAPLEPGLAVQPPDGIGHHRQPDAAPRQGVKGGRRGEARFEHQGEQPLRIGRLPIFQQAALARPRLDRDEIGAAAVIVDGDDETPAPNGDLEEDMQRRRFARSPPCLRGFGPVA